MGVQLINSLQRKTGLNALARSISISGMGKYLSTPMVQYGLVAGGAGE